MRDFINITKAMSDRNRVRALMMLKGGELCVCQIIEMLKLAPSTVSKHMYVLRQAGLVDSRKQGRWMYYRLAKKDSSKVVKDALKLANNQLKNDKQIKKDREKLNKLLKVDKEMLCKKQNKN